MLKVNDAVTLGRSFSTACLKRSQMPLLHRGGLHFCCGLMYNFISKLSHEMYSVTAYSRGNVWATCRQKGRQKIYDQREGVLLYLPRISGNELQNGSKIQSINLTNSKLSFRPLFRASCSHTAKTNKQKKSSTIEYLKIELLWGITRY